jgi:hypothetical protein
MLAKVACTHALFKTRHLKQRLESQAHAETEGSSAGISRRLVREGGRRLVACAGAVRGGVRTSGHARVEERRRRTSVKASEAVWWQYQKLFSIFLELSHRPEKKGPLE